MPKKTSHCKWTPSGKKTALFAVAQRKSSAEESPQRATALVVKRAPGDRRRDTPPPVGRLGEAEGPHL
eukprot:5523762-Alexandrium_andersonii.AAC.1